MQGIRSVAADRWRLVAHDPVLAWLDFISTSTPLYFDHYSSIRRHLYGIFHDKKGNWNSAIIIKSTKLLIVSLYLLTPSRCFHPAMLHPPPFAARKQTKQRFCSDLMLDQEPALGQSEIILPNHDAPGPVHC
jgi:hypothetical protein